MEIKQSPRSLPGIMAFLAVVVMSIAVLSGAVICSAQELPRPDASTPEKGKAERCMVGAYLTSLHDFDFTGQTFGADMWIWTHTSLESERKPLETMEFTNAKNTCSCLDTNIVKNGIRWGQRKITGTFRQHWDLRNFPFDSHKLEIRIEEGIDDTTALTYEADTRDSSYRKDIHLDAWKIMDFRIISSPVTHTSTFGDPALEPGSSSEYAGIILRITVVRKEVMSYIKLTAVAYIAFLLMLVSFFLHLDRGFRFPDARIALQAGALFATVINMSAASSALGSWDRITLVDKVHIITLFHILLGALLTVVSRALLAKGFSDHRLRQVDFCAVVLATITFIGTNGLLVIHAAHAR
ncbi:conserved membrane hypothetical protein [Syntrophobacter sp. SbD1]|nr:conserved membrane hypothetical protein [Syntrophobacter sp. SbD1]